MKTKEAFLQNIKAKIKVLQDAYDFNRSLPDDVFESLFNVPDNGHDLTIETKEVAVLTKGGNNSYEKIDIDGYGAKRDIVRRLISANERGVDKKSIISYLTSTYDLDKDKAAMMVTNTLTALAKGNEIEAIKRGKYRIKRINN